MSSKEDETFGPQWWRARRWPCALMKPLGYGELSVTRTAREDSALHDGSELSQTPHRLF